MGPCIVNIFQYTSNKMQLYTVYLYLETALHVSGGTSTHRQERIQLYLQHLVFVTPLMLPAAIVEELEHVEQFPDINKLCNVAACWIYVGKYIGLPVKYPVFLSDVDEVFEYISNKMQRYTFYFIWKLLPATKAAGSSNGLTNTRCCRYSCMRPDDGWRYHPKHVEQFPDKINCVTLQLVGDILEYYYDARTHEREIQSHFTACTKVLPKIM